ncbi:MAG: 50S ribosomal protein L9 [bacterium]|nr:50S ribosomal protein L9 [bacterium]
MEILLVQDVDNLGKRGARVNVAKGYFRNYLFPRGMAVLATDGNLRKQAEEDKVRQRTDKKYVVAAEAIKDGIDGIALEFKAQVNEEGHLYGSINEQAIVKELQGKGFKVEAGMVAMEEHIKTLGEHEIKILLHRGQGVEALIKVNVIQE